MISMAEWIIKRIELILVIAVVILGLSFISGIIFVHLDSKKLIDNENKFTQSCTENKGIAVRDLDNKMRCVPMLGKANNE